MGSSPATESPVTKLVIPNFKPVWSRSIAPAEKLIKSSKDLTLGGGVTIKEGAVIDAGGRGIGHQRLVFRR